MSPAATSVSPRILLVRFSSIGDVVLTTPLVRALRRRHPAAHIAYLVKLEYKPLLWENPHIDELIGFAPGDTLADVRRLIHRERYTHLLDLHGSLRTLALRTTAPARWRGYRKYRWSRSLLIRTKRNVTPGAPHVAERYFHAARDLDVHPDGGPPELFTMPEVAAEVDRWLRDTPLGERPFLAVAPGAKHATKRWPMEHWTALVRTVLEQDLDVCVIGGDADAEAGATLAQLRPDRVVNAAGAFDLHGTGALLRRARALISGDTGAMHMATGLGTPVIALFGPTVRAFGFFPYTKRAIVLERELSCRPCSAHGSERCPLEHHRCLRDLAPTEVASALRQLVR